MKQYKNLFTTTPDDVFVNRSNAERIVNDNNVLYSANCITSHTISDIISSSNETHLFGGGMETLTNDAILQQESLNAISNHDLCADIVTNVQSEAVEVAIATEEELPSPWIDVTTLATAPALRTQSWSEFNAFPTAVHSLVDLVGPEPYPLEIGSQLPSTENLKNIDISLSDFFYKFLVNFVSSKCFCELNRKKMNDKTLRDLRHDRVLNSDIY
jgi:hypothetical protein